MEAEMCDFSFFKLKLESFFSFVGFTVFSKYAFEMLLIYTLALPLNSTASCAITISCDKISMGES